MAKLTNAQLAAENAALRNENNTLRGQLEALRAQRPAAPAPRAGRTPYVPTEVQVARKAAMDAAKAAAMATGTTILV